MGSHRKTIPVEVQARITKYFVTNLPNRCSGADLAGVVREFGIIFDIYIARKRDRNGNSFGFVSLLDVKDRVETERKLSGVRLGDFRLRFNVARFVLEEGEVDTSCTGRDRMHGNNRNSTLPRRSMPNHGVSFKEMLVGKQEGGRNAKAVIVQEGMVVHDDRVAREIAFSSNENF
ncbi:nucleotide-binding alpha-beta plait domain-containing protein [Artemisia annua]|uniref:Nucleotide-binding alpha-beta plait domain-containing protein n=1 Tax=Artemisia annua TaxID=35608 RepID=A0A2U1MRB4_ARTAN|nr:nucleotide-binding alpha-beta plait domain-containing protein [Artemisia annua]